jgi:hypothetical protein
VSHTVALRANTLEGTKQAELFNAPAKAPRTPCGCQLIASTFAAPRIWNPGPGAALSRDGHQRRR